MKTLNLSVIFVILSSMQALASDSACPKLEGFYRSCKTLAPVGVSPDESVTIVRTLKNGLSSYEFSYTDGDKIFLTADGQTKVTPKKDENGKTYTFTDKVECQDGALKWEEKSSLARDINGRSSIIVKGESIVIRTEFFNTQGIRGVFSEECSK